MSIGSFPHKAETFDYIHPSQFVSVRKSVSPSRGAGGLGVVVCRGFWAGFGELVCRGVCGVRYLPTILVCWLSDAFGTRFSYLWQTKGHTLIHS